MTTVGFSFTTLTSEIEQGILTLTINRPEQMNALNALLLKELRHAMELAAEMESIKGIIITGSGHKAFAAGADISEISVLSATEAHEMSKKGQEIFFLIENFRKPVIAAVNGFALGGGCELAMSCHIRVCSENAKFGQPEVNLGLIAGYGGTQRLPLLIGKSKAMELLLTGDMITADQALDYGLVNHVVTQFELIPKCREILEKCFQKSPLAISSTIQAVNGFVLGDHKGYRLEADLFAAVTASEDGKEGTSAFLEKRKPAFKGR